MKITLAAHPADIKRNADGTWRHPMLPIDFPYYHIELDLWAREQSLRLHTVRERLINEDFSEWEPETPEGDGWFTILVHKDLSLASWTWAKKVTP